MSTVLEANEQNIARAAASLAAGHVVAMPTETVYGLAADATSDQAVAGIFAAKGRPSFNPLIVHFASAEDMAQDVEMPAVARVLASVFWPGPLTMVLPRRAGSGISLLCSAGLPTLAVRVPAHPVAQQLIRALGKPVAAPSANRSGSLSPTTPAHVVQSLGDAVGIVLAGGKSEIGLESTVVDVTGKVPVLLRHGSITQEDLERHVGAVQVETRAEGDSPKSPGQLLKHYAPNTPLRLRAVDVKEGEGVLAFGSTRFMNVKEGQYLNLSEKADLHEAAGNLFAMLHTLDAKGYRGIAVMDIPNTGLGIAINDRLQRAAERD